MRKIAALDETMLYWHAEWRRTSKAFVVAMRSAFYKGRRVHWCHGRHVVTGVVVSHLGHSPHCYRLRVIGQSGKEYAVDVHRILAWETGEDSAAPTTEGTDHG